MEFGCDVGTCFERNGRKSEFLKLVWLSKLNNLALSKLHSRSQEKQCSFDLWRPIAVLLQRIEQEAKQEVEVAVKAAEADPDPTLDDLYLDLYADDKMEGHVIRGCDNWSRHATN